MVVYVLGMTEVGREFNSRLLHVSPVTGNLIGGVMPKDTQKDGTNILYTSWGNHGTVQVCIDSKKEFVFIKDIGKDTGIYQGLAFNFATQEEVDKHIRSLKRAARKAFKS